MLRVLSAITALVVAVDGEPTSTSESLGVADAQMASALTRSILDDFAGTVSYKRETIRPEGARAPQGERRVQHWTVVLDGRGNLRATVSYPGSSTKWFVGRTAAQKWITYGTEGYGSQVNVFDNDVPAGDSGERIRLHMLNGLLSQAEDEVKRLLGPPASDGPAEILFVDQSATNPVATVEANGAVKSITFDRVGDALRVRSVVSGVHREYDAFTFRWTYSGHQQIAGHWAATTALFEQIAQVHPSNSLQRRYSGIQVSPTSDRSSAGLRRVSQLPQFGDPNTEGVAIVVTVSINDVSVTSFVDGSEIPSE